MGRETPMSKETTDWKAIRTTIESDLIYFRRNIGFKAPELQDEAWEQIAETIVHDVRVMVEGGRWGEPI
jgi:hypothetical protein